jgi:hypothetical protein
MLAKSGRLPTRGEWAYEVKWDGFRAIVSTEGKLRVRSGRGWNMTPHVDFLGQLLVSGLDCSRGPLKIGAEVFHYLENDHLRDDNC